MKAEPGSLTAHRSEERSALKCRCENWWRKLGDVPNTGSFLFAHRGSGGPNCPSLIRHQLIQEAGHCDTALTKAEWCVILNSHSVQTSSLHESWSFKQLTTPLLLMNQWPKCHSSAPVMLRRCAEQQSDQCLLLAPPGFWKAGYSKKAKSKLNTKTRKRKQSRQTKTHTGFMNGPQDKPEFSSPSSIIHLWTCFFPSTCSYQIVGSFLYLMGERKPRGPPLENKDCLYNKSGEQHKTAWGNWLFGRDYLGRESNIYLGSVSAANTMCLRNCWSVTEKFILLWVVSSSPSGGIDFPRWINYQRQFQTSLRWMEGKMMFSFQWSLLAIMLRASGAPESTNQRPQRRATVHGLFILSAVPESAWSGDSANRRHMALSCDL